MREAISAFFSLIALTIKMLSNVAKSGEVMSKELHISAKAFASEQQISREINIVKARKSLDKELSKHGLKYADVAKTAQARSEATDDDEVEAVTSAKAA